MDHVQAGALDGVRVLEFSQVVSAAIAGVTLSDMGADIVKVEPPGGETYRNNGAIVPNEGQRFQTLNRGKRSLIVDLHRPEGRALIHRIVPGFDVVITNYRPGVPERLEIDYATLASLHPALIYAQISGFGLGGPMGERGGSDIVASAYAGLIAGNGKLDEFGAPDLVGCGPISDYLSGFAIVGGICAALYRRALSGHGEEIQSSLLQSALILEDSAVMRHPPTDAVTRDPMMEEIRELRARGASYAEILEVRERWRSRRAAQRMYYRGYQAKDGAIVLGALTTATRAAARRVLGVEDEPTADPEFDVLDPENAARVAEWKVRVRELIRSRTVAEWLRDFEAGGVPAAPVQLPEELSDDPQVVVLDMGVELDHAVTGPQRVVGPALRTRHSTTAARAPSPPLGAHTDEVLAEAGLTDEEIAALRERAVIA